MQRGAGARLHRDHLRATAAAAPGGDAADQAAAAHRDQQRVEIGALLRPLERDRALAGEDLVLVVGMHDERAAPGGEGLAGGEGLCVALAGQVQRGAQRAQPGLLGSRRGGRNEDVRGQAEVGRRQRDRDAVVAARRGDHAGAAQLGGRGWFFHGREDAVEGAAGLEGARALQAFELQVDDAAGDFDVDHRRLADAAGDAPPGFADPVAVDGGMAGRGHAGCAGSAGMGVVRRGEASGDYRSAAMRPERDRMHAGSFVARV